ncbi:thiamine biosynthesis protein ThiS [Paucibacter sp. KBW04]|uniref:sulfur carrier protein ThiS n=1 Tax=Paucibacter sp. KBW04 TaxID=2153361 RepID=UPI000F55D832|nr:sulfur carrier protein ThiS [Paucibacter sp. KBW04]RQO55632.1 thiamine biosynthesis protein ThiS [Paucibacter sp. KBW04]
MSTTIQIQLDEQALSLPAHTTLAQLLEQSQRSPESVATALNGRFVPREARPGTPLHDGDTVLLFKPIVGG